eukprot:COSAG02_NODE_8477_length_2557_cov_1.404394_1_plen_40_part_10
MHDDDDDSGGSYIRSQGNLTRAQSVPSFDFVSRGDIAIRC